MKSHRIISMSLFVILSAALILPAQQAEPSAAEKEKAKQQTKAERDKAKSPTKAVVAPSQQQQTQEKQRANQERQAQQQQVQQKQRANQDRQTQQQQQVQDKQRVNQARQAQQQQKVRTQQQQQVRLPQQRQQELIREQQQRVSQYRQHLEEQQRLAQQHAAQLHQQKRMAQYRFQQQYVERLRQQQAALRRSYNYNNDPYFYTAPIYRYNRGGSYYEINQYGAEVLRQAVNYGYEEGFRAGRADRQDRWMNGFEDSYAYQDANYGYSGYYVDQEAYNFYFREGFRRGYEDGFNSRYQYGRYANGRYNILGAILSQILNFESMR